MTLVGLLPGVLFFSVNFFSFGLFFGRYNVSCALNEFIMDELIVMGCICVQLWILTGFIQKMFWLKVISVISFIIYALIPLIFFILDLENNNSPKYSNYVEYNCESNNVNLVFMSIAIVPCSTSLLLYAFYFLFCKYHGKQLYKNKFIVCF